MAELQKKKLRVSNVKVYDLEESIIASGYPKRTVAAIRPVEDKDIKRCYNLKRIMCIIPIVIMLYLRLETGDFMDVLYHNLFGIIVMSTCLMVYIVSYFMAEKVIAIEV